MTELQTLKEQRRELDKKIRELETNVISYGDVRVCTRERDINKYIAQVSVKGFSKDYGYRSKNDSRWHIIAQGESREEVIERLKVISCDITGFIEKMEGIM